MVVINMTCTTPFSSWQASGGDCTEGGGREHSVSFQSSESPNGFINEH